MGLGFSPPSDEGLIRVTTFRVPENRPSVVAELRRTPDAGWGRFRWVGRRLMDDPNGPEIVVVSLWNSAAEMERGVSGQAPFSAELRAAIAGRVVEVYTCRAYGAWRRDREPCLVRLFRGEVVQGDPETFDPQVARAYLAKFEENPRCAAIAAGVRDGSGVLLATLWTDWDAVVSATGGDLRRVLPIRLPGWGVDGTADHYEAVAVEIGRAP